VPPEGDLCANPISIPLSQDVWGPEMWSDYIDSVTLDPELGCGDANGRDVWFEVEVGANQVLTAVETNYLIPTVLQVVEACGPEEPCLDWGNEYVQWYNTSGATATILVGVEAEYPSITAGPVEVEFHRDVIPEGDACSDPIDVDETSLPYSDTVDLWQFGAAWPTSLCEPAEGSDVWYAVDVPPDQVVFFEELSSTDTTVYLATECPADDCVSSADEPEAVNWYNTTSSTVTVYGIAKAKSVWDNAATLNVEIDVHEASEGDFCSIAIDLTDVTYPYTWTGNLTDFTNGFTGLEENGCTETMGNDVWFAVTVPPDLNLVVKEMTSTVTAVHVLESCATNNCHFSGTESGGYSNSTSSDVVVYVVVETIDAAPGPIEVEFDAVECVQTAFDSASLEGWELAGDCNAAGYCWGVSSYRASSGTYSINYGNGGSPPNFDAGIANHGSILTPWFTVNPDHPNVTFDVWSETEGSTYYDQLTIYLVRDSIPDVQVWNSGTAGVYNTLAWTPATVNLAAYGGSVARLKFYFDSVDSVANDYEGYYVDSVEICCD